MRLFGFRYLKWQRILTLTIILTLLSALFSLTALSLLGFYKGFTGYLGEGKDRVVLCDRNSRTPFTGLVPTYLAYNIGNLSGVLASSPEVVAPCIIKGEAMFLRGVVPEEFLEFEDLTIVSGSLIDMIDLGSVIVGMDAAKKLGLNVGDRVLIISALTDRYVEVQVKGVYISNNPILEDEVLAPLPLGQWLRGTSYEHVSFIRFKINNNLVSASEIFEEVAKEVTQQSQPSQEEGRPKPEEAITPRVTTRFRIEDLEVKETSEFMKDYVDKYGLTREIMLTLSAIIFLFSGATILIATKTIIAQHRDEINVLKSLGASKRLLKRDALIKILPWSVVASLSGSALAVVALSLLQEGGYLMVLSHTITLQMDPLIAVLSILLTILLVSVCILGSNFN